MTMFARRPFESPQGPPPPVSFIFPRADAKLRDWMQHASDVIARDPGKYLLTRKQSDELAAHAAAFHDALQLAGSRETRTPLAVCEKNRARDRALPLFRAAMQHIRPQLTIDLDAKLALGCRPAGQGGRMPIDPPDSWPLLTILSIDDRAHTLRFADSRTPNRRGKPKGVANAELRIAVTDAPPPPPPEDNPPCPEGTPADQLIQSVLAERSPERCRMMSRSPFTIRFDAVDVGRVAVYIARWRTGAGRTGPWTEMPVSAVVSAIITGGSGEMNGGGR